MGRGAGRSAAAPAVGLRLMDQEQRFLGQADGGERAAKAAMAQLGGQRLGWDVAAGQVADQGDRRERARRVAARRRERRRGPSSRRSR